MRPVTILLDFDGTITKEDLVYQILERFGDGDWKALDLLYDEGSISLIECMRRQYSMIKGQKSVLEDYIAQIVDFRDGFQEFVNFCTLNDFKLRILSAGLDFAIKYCLEMLNIDLEVIAVETQFLDNRIVVNTESVMSTDSLDFKAVRVDTEKTNGNTVVMIGDGLTDRQAARHSDFTFAVKGVSLDKYCNSHHLDYTTFENFNEVISILKKKFS